MSSRTSAFNKPFKHGSNLEVNAPVFQSNSDQKKTNKLKISPEVGLKQSSNPFGDAEESHERSPVQK